MDNLYKQLDSICRNHLLSEKLLIMPTITQGYNLLTSFSLAGYKSINLKHTTLLDIAKDYIKDDIEKDGLTYLSNYAGINIILEIMETLSSNSKLSYFNRIPLSTGIARALYTAITDLKMAEISPSEVHETAFTVKDKHNDLVLIYEEYIKTLKNLNLLDTADIYNKAVGMAVKSNAPIYIIPSNLNLTSIEKKFLEHCTGNKVNLLSLPKIQGLTPPRGRIAATKEPDKEETSTFASLYSTKDLKSPSSLPPTKIFHSYGTTCEVKEILREIKKSPLPFDKNLICYTTTEPYSQLFYDISQRFNIPMTYGDGISIKNSKPGRLYFSILDWISKNFMELVLRGILTSGDIDLDDDNAPSSNSIARELRRLSIGWGRDRYIPSLEVAIEEYWKKLESEEDEERKGYYTEQHSKLLWICTFVKGLLDFIPIPDSDMNIDLSKLIQGIEQIIQNHGRVSNSLDGEGKKLLVERLQEIGVAVRGKRINIGEGIKRLQELVDGERIGRSHPTPGHLHIDSYKRSIWFDFDRTFIVGLDANSFPGSPIDDPILLDYEREKISEALRLNSRKPAENNHEMIEFLSTRRGELCFSFSAFDTVENRERFPSPIILQIYRLLKQNDTLSYSDLTMDLGTMRCITPANDKETLDEYEWWMTLVRGNTRSYKDIILERFTSLSDGTKAESHRQRSVFTEYDGKINVIKPFDFTKNPLSASQLEKLGTCPHLYFISNILGIYPPDETIYDPGSWLDPAQRGTLLHSIFERVMKTLNEKGEKPSSLNHQQLLKDTAEDLINEFKERIPFPSEVIFEVESREILESSYVFLKSEEEFLKDSEPLFFELSFGINVDAHPVLGNIDPVKIQLPSGKWFYLRGFIDRVDRIKDNFFRVLDYKTGSTYGYEIKNLYKGGRQLQHALYGIALEIILMDKGYCQDPIVLESGYAFPTLRGEGQRVIRSLDKKDDSYNVLELLISTMEKGLFIPTEDMNDCKFCDYKIICRRQNYNEEVLGSKMMEALLGEVRKHG